MITNTNQITLQQMHALEHLGEVCKKADGSIPCLYTHILLQHRSFPASFLYYEDHELIGFLGVYFFYDEAVEVSILVHPAHRRKGIARKLLLELLPLIQLQNYFTLIFSTPTHINSTWLRARGYFYMHSEYAMQREDLSPILEYKHEVIFRLATAKDIPVLCALDEVCFPQRNGSLHTRFQHLLNNREYQVFLIFYQHHPIGKAHIRWQERGASLSDIAILPVQQGRGFGTTLIAHCINLALSEGKPKILLDVETHNQRALNLYTRLGFAVQNACDFWSIDIEQLLPKKHA